MSVNTDNLQEIFRYHAPCAAQLGSYAAIRESAMEFARTILECVPPCADQQAALRKVREAMMTANAAVATEGRV